MQAAGWNVELQISPRKRPDTLENEDWVCNICATGLERPIALKFCEHYYICMRACEGLSLSGGGDQTILHM